ncbi:hypothetical protein LOD99_14408 [Oopsacas minuta]|uniref:Uncharacterized protein n=1 Tax=Oopsacas minuta TaxID=111878 RepID=A0AAV7KFH5_9METZ|nr:hypothetical protein LOD99_14408 [Oopsacas minuta]
MDVNRFLYPFLSTALVGCCGILPFFPYKYIIKHSNNDGFVSLKLLAMYFATGCLVSEIFLHLLPEIWRIALSQDQMDEYSLKWIAKVCLGGFIVFLLGDKLFSLIMSAPEDTNGGEGDSFSTIGYLNVFANIMDNFVHALSITTSYSNGIRNGIITTCVIIIHEIPHEIGDFSILLQSGFSLNTALKLQLLTSIGGISGVAIGLFSQEFLTEDTLFILSAITGGFFYIVCASCLPEILNESSRSKSRSFISETSLFLLGTLITGVISVFC